MNSPDGFRRQPAGAGKSNAGQPPADHPQEMARAGILRLATWVFYRGALRLPRATGQKPRCDRDDREHHHHKDGRGEHLHQLWHGSVSPMTGAVAECAPQGKPGLIKPVWLPAEACVEGPPVWPDHCAIFRFLDLCIAIEMAT
jgi:hypothetical protein